MRLGKFFSLGNWSMQKNQLINKEALTVLCCVVKHLCTYQWLFFSFLFSKMADLLSVLSLIPLSFTFQDGGWVKFLILGTLPTCASLSLISVGFPPSPPPPPPISWQTIDRCIRKQLEHERSRRGTTWRSRVFVPEFSSRFVSALQQNRKASFFLLW